MILKVVAGITVYLIVFIFVVGCFDVSTKRSAEEKEAEKRWARERQSINRKEH